MVSGGSPPNPGNDAACGIASLHLICLRMLVGSVSAMLRVQGASDGQHQSLRGASTANSAGFLLPLGASATPSEVFGIKSPIMVCFLLPCSNCSHGVVCSDQRQLWLARHTREH